LSKKVKIKTFAKSDVGLVRQNNEDVFAVLHEENFFIVADGMGGHKAGEIAAQKAVDYMCGAIKTLPEISCIHELSSKVQLFIESANYWVNHLGNKDPSLKGMGTTLCSLLLHEKRVLFSHVGDSRIYLLRENILNPLTTDHSVPHQIYTKKRILTRVVGTSPEVFPEIKHEEIRKGDIYLLCSDGLTDLLDDREIEKVINSKGSLEEKGDLLIQMAKSRGGHDNITLVLVEIEE